MVEITKVTRKLPHYVKFQARVRPIVQRVRGRAKRERDRKWKVEYDILLGRKEEDAVNAACGEEIRG